jgi:hypothetical protein
VKQFRAHWGALLIVLSVLGTVLCLGVSVLLAFKLEAIGGPRGMAWVCPLPAITVAGCALFTIRGYTIMPGAIQIHRLFWATRLPTHGLQSASYEPSAMRWSIRMLGNGGLFSFSGLYWNRRLGSYRAFVTDTKQTVVLRFPNRTVVMSPTFPEQFVYDLAATPA